MSGNGYTTTMSAAGVAETIGAARRVVVTTHAKPDGDAVGSVLACVRLVQRLGGGREAEGWFAGPFPSWLGTVAGATPIRKLGESTASVGRPWDDADLVLVVDTGSWSQVEPVKAWLSARVDRTLIIDHHLHGSPDLAERRLIETGAASCTQVIAGVVDAALGLGGGGGRGGGAMPADIAEALYLGLATDTGWFRFSNTGAATLRAAARMLEAGVDAPRLYEMIEQQQAAARPRLLGAALSSLRWYGGGRVGVMSLTQRDVQAAGGQSEDVGGFAEPALSVQGAQVVVTLTEMTKPGEAKPLTKASLRSKPGPGAVDVAAVSATLGGGGHARAAGIKLAMEIGAAQAAVLRALGVDEREIAAGGRA